MTQEKATRIKELRQKLANLSEQDKAALVARGLVATVEGRPLSLRNTLLVYMQSPGIYSGTATLPTVVGGFQQWKRAGKSVRKGEHGFMIWFPVGPKDDDGDIISAERFFTGTVFDISQVEESKAPESLPAPAMA